MSKGRTIVGYGPTTLSVANTTGVKDSGWIKFGPYIGSNVGAQLVFSRTTADANGTLWGAITTASTVGWIRLVQKAGNAGGQFRATSTHLFGHVKLRSTAKGSTNCTVTAYFAAVP